MMTKRKVRGERGSLNDLETRREEEVFVDGGLLFSC